MVLAIQHRADFSNNPRHWVHFEMRVGKLVRTRGVLGVVVFTYFAYVCERSWLQVWSPGSYHEVPCDAKPVNELQKSNSNKKVLAYSLFAPLSEAEKSDFPFFLDGMRQNAKDARLYYPDWLVRVYVIGLSSEQESTLRKEPNLEIIRCRSSSLLTASSSRKMMTRFLAMDDPLVEYAIFRDADSRLSPRELFAVNEWLASGYGFHAMRDHEQHSVPVLGGMFGTRRGVLPSKVWSLMQQAISENPDGIQGVRGEDQSFLKAYMWEKVRGSCVAHDVDLDRCNRFGSIECRDFPMHGRSEDSNFFVGAMFKHDAHSSTSAHYTCQVSCTIAP